VFAVFKQNKFITSLILCLLFFAGSHAFADTRNPEEYFFDSTFGDFTEELSNAKESGKKAIFIFFEMDECPFCHWMKTNVLNHVKVQDYFKEHFLIFSIDVEGDVEMTDFRGESMTQKEFALKENRVRATPVLAFFDLTGKRVMRYTGKTRNVEEFLLMGKFVVDKEYQNTKFSRYKRAQKK
jgi:thioredoxin-related protein